MKDISIFKNNDKKSENEPDYRIVASYKDASGTWSSQTVGSLWKPKESNPNGPALKGKLSEAREYNGKQYQGYKIVPDGVTTPAASSSVLPKFPEEEINPEDIPFN